MEGGSKKHHFFDRFFRIEVTNADFRMIVL
jgi:hypothetical protein